MRRLLVLRHGESAWNREGRWQGWEDIALTPIGEAQARARGAELRGAGHEVHFAAEEGDPAYLVWRERLRGSSARHVVMAGRASAMRAMLPVVVEVFEQLKDALVQESTR